MNTRTHAELATFIWSICNLLRGPYKRNEYRKVILPLTVLRRFDCVLEGTKEAVLAADAAYTGDSANVRRQLLEEASGRPFYNTSRLDFGRLLDDPNNIAQNLSRYIRDFSDNVFEIMQRFGFELNNPGRTSSPHRHDNRPRPVSVNQSAAAASSEISARRRMTNSRRCSVSATWPSPRGRTRKCCRSSSSVAQNREADSKLPKPSIGSNAASRPDGSARLVVEVRVVRCSTLRPRIPRIGPREAGCSWVVTRRGFPPAAWASCHRNRRAAYLSRCSLSISARMSNGATQRMVLEPGAERRPCSEGAGR